VRKQLDNLDQFVTVGGEPDLALNFKQPGLWLEDMVFLFKQSPAAGAKTSTATSPRACRQDRLRAVFRS
jgi:hypothetical protein